jgi:hypothetical protein
MDEAIQRERNRRRVTENSPELLEWSRWDYWIEKLDRPDIWYKRLGNYALQKHYFGFRAQRGAIQKFILVDRRTSQKFDLTKTTWADVDQQGRLVLAKEGKLFSGVVSDGELALTELADFNANKPERWRRRIGHRGGKITPAVCSLLVPHHSLLKDTNLCPPSNWSPKSPARRAARSSPGAKPLPRAAQPN